MQYMLKDLSDYVQHGSQAWQNFAHISRSIHCVPKLALPTLLHTSLIQFVVYGF